MQRITPFLWFNGQAEPAMEFYLSIFKNSKKISISRYGDAGPGPVGSVMTVAFQLDGQDFVGLNGGPEFGFSPAISFVVNCETQAEVDHYWNALTQGGEAIECGWLKDKFGVSWQIVPVEFWKMIQDTDPVKSNRVMQALMKMKKLELAALKAAYEAE